MSVPGLLHNMIMAPNKQECLFLNQKFRSFTKNKTSAFMLQRFKASALAQAIALPQPFSHPEQSSIWRLKHQKRNKDELQKKKK